MAKHFDAQSAQSEDFSFDLFAPAQDEETNQPATAKVLPFVRKETMPVQENACAGCYYMGWGKGLRLLCRHQQHPGPLLAQPFCLDENEKKKHYIAFDQVGSARMSYEEMAQNNLT